MTGALAMSCSSVGMTMVVALESAAAIIKTHVSPYTFIWFIGPPGISYSDKRTAPGSGFHQLRQLEAGVAVMAGAAVEGAAQLLSRSAAQLRRPPKKAVR